MYLEGKSYQQIANILNDEKVPYPVKSKWGNSTIKKIINNTVYMGDFERYKKDKTRKSKIYMNVVPPIISRAMWEDTQNQKGKNQRAFSRHCIYIAFQKLICQKCGRIMTGIKVLVAKSLNICITLVKSAKFPLMKMMLKEPLMDYILDFIKYDYNVNKFSTLYLPKRKMMKVKK